MFKNTLGALVLSSSIGCGEYMANSIGDRADRYEREIKIQQECPSTSIGPEKSYTKGLEDGERYAAQQVIVDTIKRAHPSQQNLFVKTETAKACWAIEYGGRPNASRFPALTSCLKAEERFLTAQTRGDIYDDQRETLGVRSEAARCSSAVSRVFLNSGDSADYQKILEGLKPNPDPLIAKLDAISKEGQDPPLDPRSRLGREDMIYTYRNGVVSPQDHQAYDVGFTVGYDVGTIRAKITMELHPATLILDPNKMASIKAKCEPQNPFRENPRNQAYRSPRIFHTINPQSIAYVEWIDQHENGNPFEFEKIPLTPQGVKNMYRPLVRSVPAVKDIMESANGTLTCVIGVKSNN